MLPNIDLCRTAQDDVDHIFNLPAEPGHESSTQVSPRRRTRGVVGFVGDDHSISSYPRQSFTQSTADETLYTNSFHAASYMSPKKCKKASIVQHSYSTPVRGTMDSSLHSCSPTKQSVSMSSSLHDPSSLAQRSKSMQHSAPIRAVSQLGRRGSLDNNGVRASSYMSPTKCKSSIHHAMLSPIRATMDSSLHSCSPTKESISMSISLHKSSSFALRSKSMQHSATIRPVSKHGRRGSLESSLHSCTTRPDSMNMNTRPVREIPLSRSMHASSQSPQTPSRRGSLDGSLHSCQPSRQLTMTDMLVRSRSRDFPSSPIPRVVMSRTFSSDSLFELSDEVSDDDSDWDDFAEDVEPPPSTSRPCLDSSKVTSARASQVHSLARHTVPLIRQR